MWVSPWFGIKIKLVINRFFRWKILMEQNSESKIYLIFVQFTVFVFLFSFVLKCDDNETNKYVHHEECNNNNIDDVVCCNNWPEVVDGSPVFCIGVYRHIQ